MSTQGKQDNQLSVTGSKQKKQTVDKALLQQQREQLRQMVIDRLVTDHAQNKQKNIKIINDLVNEYFQNNKVTDSSLKQLKEQVQSSLAQAASEKRSFVEKSQTNENNSISGQIAAPELNKNQQAGADKSTGENLKLQPIKQAGKTHSKASRSVRDDQSEVSSKAPRSVYMMDGDEENEWATLVKFDTELFKKEQELEKMRQLEFKKKIKSELDKQVTEKQYKKKDDQLDEIAYVELADNQRNLYDNREKEKQNSHQKKIYTEKLQRDKQVRDEYQRRKIELKREKELDDLLVKKIKEELDLEQQELQQRRNKERDRLLRMMKENEEYRKKAQEDARLEKEAETQMQQQYINLQDQLEEQREREKKEREEKMKKVMGMYAESVVKDQKEIMKQEDEKLLKNIIHLNKREKQEDERKKQRQYEQKNQMRQFLNHQIEEKKRRQQEDEELDKRQAQIWQQDLYNYNDHEKKKHDYIKEVNLRHAEILKNQMTEKEYKSKNRVHKMNTIELLQNKNRLKEIAINDPLIGQNVKKVEIGVENTA